MIYAARHVVVGEVSRLFRVTRVAPPAVRRPPSNTPPSVVLEYQALFTRLDVTSPVNK